MATDPDRGAQGGQTSTGKGVTVSRLMNPDDANIMGNVHGGTILKLIEEAGAIIATRYCNNIPERDEPGYEASVAALARVERTDFLQPMFIGEVAELVSEVVFTSAHSLEVVVNVYAENVLTGKKRMTNSARLWYVPLSMKDTEKVMPVPPLTYSDPAIEEKGRQAYERQKAERKAFAEKKMQMKRTISLTDLADDASPHTVAYSKSQLIHWVGPSDVTQIGHCRGGVIMKLVDECAGIVAVKHCKSAVVTASFDATNFHSKVGKGGLITVTGEATFTANKTIEVEVIVDVEVPWQGHNKKRSAVDSFITYVCLDGDMKPRPIPQLILKTEEERERFEAGKQRNEWSKQVRMAAKQH